MATKKKARRYVRLALFILFICLFVVILGTRFSQSEKCPVLLLEHQDKAEDKATHVEAPAYAPPVPCLGVALGSDPNLFLLRLLYSIDHPVERIIVAYGGNETSTEAELNHGIHSFPNLTTTYLGRWSGVAQGWNRIIESCPEAKWYMILNMDVQVVW
jgi:hypothetical protein